MERAHKMKGGILGFEEEEAKEEKKRKEREEEIEREH